MSAEIPSIKKIDLQIEERKSPTDAKERNAKWLEAIKRVQKDIKDRIAAVPESVAKNPKIQEKLQKLQHTLEQLDAIQKRLEQAKGTANEAQQTLLDQNLAGDEFRAVGEAIKNINGLIYDINGGFPLQGAEGGVHARTEPITVDGSNPGPQPSGHMDTPSDTSLVSSKTAKIHKQPKPAGAAQPAAEKEPDEVDPGLIPRILNAIGLNTEAAPAANLAETAAKPVDQTIESKTPDAAPEKTPEVVSIDKELVTKTVNERVKSIVLKIASSLNGTLTPELLKQAQKNVDTSVKFISNEVKTTIDKDATAKTNADLLNVGAAKAMEYILKLNFGLGALKFEKQNPDDPKDIATALHNAIMYTYGGSAKPFADLEQVVTTAPAAPAAAPESKPAHTPNGRERKPKAPKSNGLQDLPADIAHG